MNRPGSREQRKTPRRKIQTAYRHSKTLLWQLLILCRGRVFIFNARFTGLVCFVIEIHDKVISSTMENISIVIPQFFLFFAGNTY